MKQKLIAAAIVVTICGGAYVTSDAGKRLLSSIHLFPNKDLEAAQKAYSNGEYQTVSDLCTKVLTSDPKNPDAYKLRSQAEYAQGYYQPAYVDAATGAMYAPKDIGLLNAQGLAGIQIGYFNDARKAYQAAIDAGDKTYIPLLGLADVAHGERNYDEARTLYEKVLKVEKRSDIYKRIAQNEFDANKLQAARDAIDQALKLKPHDVALIENKVAICVAQEDSPAAIDFLQGEATRAKAQAQPPIVALLRKVARNYLKICDSLIRRAPRDFRGWSGVAVSEYALDHPERALEAANKAIELNPEAKYAYKVRGKITQQSNPASAKADFEKAIQLDGNKDSSLVFELATAEFYGKQYPESQKHYSEYAQRTPDDAAAYFNLSLVSAKLKELENRRKYLETALRLVPADTGYLSAMSDALLDLNDVSGALTYARKAVDLDPSDIRRHVDLAGCLVNNKMWAEADKEIDILQKDKRSDDIKWCGQKAAAANPAYAVKWLGSIPVPQDKESDAEFRYLAACWLAHSLAEGVPSANTHIRELRKQAPDMSEHQQHTLDALLTGDTSDKIITEAQQTNQKIRAQFTIGMTNYFAGNKAQAKQFFSKIAVPENKDCWEYDWSKDMLTKL